MSNSIYPSINPYSSRLRCQFCRRNGHRYEDCHAHLLSRLYTCIQHDINFEIICFKIIRNFTIREISNIFVAIHEERGIAYPPITNASFLHLVPTITTILLEEEEIVNIMNNEFNENQENEIPFNQNQNQENEMQVEYEEQPQTEENNNIESLNMVLEEEEYYFPPASRVSTDYNLIERDENEINTQFPLSLQNLSSNINQLNQTMVLNNEDDDYWPIPPLIDASGNIVSFPPPASYSLVPVQITLNERIEIIPKNSCPVAEEDFCPVCYENYNTTNIIKTECGHCFCFDCVKKFTKDHKKCPMCRENIFKLNVHIENFV